MFAKDHQARILQIKLAYQLRNLMSEEVWDDIMKWLESDYLNSVIPLLNYCILSIGNNPRKSNHMFKSVINLIYKDKDLSPIAEELVPLRKLQRIYAFDYQADLHFKCFKGHQSAIIQSYKKASSIRQELELIMNEKNWWIAMQGGSFNLNTKEPQDIILYLLYLICKTAESVNIRNRAISLNINDLADVVSCFCRLNKGVEIFNLLCKCTHPDF